MAEWHKRVHQLTQPGDYVYIRRRDCNIDTNTFALAVLLCSALLL